LTFFLLVFTFSIFSIGLFLVFFPIPSYSPLSIVYSSFIHCLLSCHLCLRVFHIFSFQFSNALCVKRLKANMKASSNMERRGQLKMILTIEDWKVQPLIRQRFLHHQRFFLYIFIKLGFLDLVSIFSFGNFFFCAIITSKLIILLLCSEIYPSLSFYLFLVLD